MGRLKSLGKAGSVWTSLPKASNCTFPTLFFLLVGRVTHGPSLLGYFFPT